MNRVILRHRFNTAVPEAGYAAWGAGRASPLLGRCGAVRPARRLRQWQRALQGGVAVPLLGRCCRTGGRHGGRAAAASADPDFHAATALCAAGLQEDQQSRDNWHLVLHSVFRDSRAASPASLRKLEALTLARAAFLNLDSWVVAMYALAASGHRPCAQLVDRFVETTGDRAAALSAGQQRRVARTIRLLGCTVTERWARRFCGVVAASAGQFELGDLVDTCTDVCEQAAVSAAAAASSNESEAAACPEPALPPALAAALQSRSTTNELLRLQPRQVSALCGLLASAGAQLSEKQQHDLSVACQDSLIAFTAEEAVGALYGLVSLGIQPSGVMRRAVEAATEAHMGELSGRALARTVWLHAALGGGAPTAVSTSGAGGGLRTAAAWMDAFLSAVDAKVVSGMGAQDVLMVVLSLSALDASKPRVGGGLLLQRLASLWPSLPEADRRKLRLLGYGTAIDDEQP